MEKLKSWTKSIRSVGLIACFLAVGCMTSCDKELYSEEDAQKAMEAASKSKLDAAIELENLRWSNEQARINLEAQIQEAQIANAVNLLKWELTSTDVSVLLKDVTNLDADMSGFSVVSTQSSIDGKEISGTTNANGWVNLTIKGGEALVYITKSGYPRTLAYIQPDLTLANNTFIIPLVPMSTTNGKIEGTLKAKTDLTVEGLQTVPGVTVGITVDPTSFLTDEFKDLYGIKNPTEEGPLKGNSYQAVAYEGLLEPVKTDANGKFVFEVPSINKEIEYTLTVNNTAVAVKGYHAEPYNVSNPVTLTETKAWLFNNPSSANTMYPFGQFYATNGSSSYYEYYAGVELLIEGPAGTNPDDERADLQYRNTHAITTIYEVEKGEMKMNYGNNADYPAYNLTDLNMITAFGKGFDNTDNFTYKEDVIPAAKFIEKGDDKLVFSAEVTQGGKYTIQSKYILDGSYRGGYQFYTFEEAVKHSLKNSNGDAYKRANITTFLNAADKKVEFNITEKGKGYTAKPNIFLYVAVDVRKPATYDYFRYTDNQDSVKFYEISGVSGLFKLDDTSIEWVDDTKKSVALPSAITDDDLTQGRVRLVTYSGDSNIPNVNNTSGSIFVQSYVIKYQKDGYQKAGHAMTLYRDMTCNYLIPSASNYVSTVTSSIDDIEFSVKYAGKYASAPTVKLYIDTYEVGEATLTLDAAGKVTGHKDFKLLDGVDWDLKAAGSYNLSLAVPTSYGDALQAYARAYVDPYDGSIEDVYLSDVESTLDTWYFDIAKGYGYSVTPKVTVKPIGDYTPIKEAVIKAKLNSIGRGITLEIEDGGEGYKGNIFDYYSATSPKTFTVTTNGTETKNVLLEYGVTYVEGYKIVTP